MSLRRLGTFELLARLASGGAAHVFLARDADGPRSLLALKVLQPSLALNDDFRQMFFTEARIAAHLKHPNVVQIAGFGQLDGAHCLALEYVFGASLADVLRASARAQRPLSVGALLSLTASICDALHYAHELTDEHNRPMGLVHRDVTPQNILVGFDGVPKLTDFGIAKATGRGWETQVGIVKGKFSYMSPEQALGKNVDRRSDIFGVGIVLWEALTGHDLFKGTAPAEVIRSIRDQRIEPPSKVVSGLTSIVDPIVMRALQRSPRRRYATAREMGLDIRDIIERAGVVIDAGSVSRELAEIYGDVMKERALALRSAMSSTEPDVQELARVLGAHLVDVRMLPELGPRQRAEARAKRGRAHGAELGAQWEDTTTNDDAGDDLLRLLSTADVSAGELPLNFLSRFQRKSPDAHATGSIFGRVEPESSDAGAPAASGSASIAEVLPDTPTDSLTPRAVSSWDDADSDAELAARPDEVPPELTAEGPAYRPATRPPAEALAPEDATQPLAALEDATEQVPAATRPASPRRLPEDAPTQLNRAPPAAVPASTAPTFARAAASRAPTAAPASRAAAPRSASGRVLEPDPVTDLHAAGVRMSPVWLTVGGVALVAVGVGIGWWLGAR